MTTTTHVSSHGETTPQSIARALRPIFRRIYADATTREVEATPLHREVSNLADAGLGKLRLPAEFGGAAGSVSDLASLLIELGTADSNFVQIFRGHFGFIEFLVSQQRTSARDELLHAAGRGDIFGPAASVSASAPPGSSPPQTIIDSSTRIELRAGDEFLTGTKFYTTGSLHAQWINVLVVDTEGVREAVVHRDDPGVSVVDDWNGFGQRFTASGTARFEQVKLRHGYTFPRNDDGVGEYLAAFYQFVHSATQAGIIARAAEDAARFVRHRKRMYPLAPASQPSQDPQVLEAVGNIAVAAFGARSAVNSVAVELDQYAEQRTADALERAIVASASAQVLNTRAAGEATWGLFDAGSASATDQSLALDRHWRNARTISSHNPVIYKARVVGDHAVNGTLPDSSGGLLQPTRR